MRLAYKHHVTVVLIPAGVKVGAITSKEGSYLVTSSTDPEITAPTIIQPNSKLLEQFSVQAEYVPNSFWPYYYHGYPYYNSGAAGVAGSSSGANQLNFQNGQNYAGLFQAQLVASGAQQSGNTQVGNAQTDWIKANTELTLEEAQNEVNKLTITSGAV
jgi:hypothetical protein